MAFFPGFQRWRSDLVHDKHHQTFSVLPGRRGLQLSVMRLLQLQLQLQRAAVGLSVCEDMIEDFVLLLYFELHGQPRPVARHEPGEFVHGAIGSALSARDW